MNRDSLLLRYAGNDLVKNKGVNLALLVVLVLSAFLMATGAMVIERLVGAVDQLYTEAKPPHFLQMHKGDYDAEALQRFAAGQPDIQAWTVVQMCRVRQLSPVLAAPLDGADRRPVGEPDRQPVRPAEPRLRLPDRPVRRHRPARPRRGLPAGGLPAALRSPTRRPAAGQAPRQGARADRPRLRAGRANGVLAVVVHPVPGLAGRSGCARPHGRRRAGDHRGVPAAGCRRHRPAAERLRRRRCAAQERPGGDLPNDPHHQRLQRRSGRDSPHVRQRRADHHRRAEPPVRDPRDPPGPGPRDRRDEGDRMRTGRCRGCTWRSTA